MRIRLAFSILVDLDLLSLMHVPEFNFKAWVRDSLRAFATTGEFRRVPLPTSVPDSMVLQNITLSISLDPVKDAEVEKWLDSIKYKQRSGTIKTLLRNSLTGGFFLAQYKNYPTTFLPTPPKNKRIAASGTGYTAPANRNTAVSGTPLSQTAPAQPPDNEEDDEFDIFSMSMEVVEEGGE